MTITLPTGQTIRCTSKRRYSVIIARPGERAFVHRNTDSYAKAREVEFWNAHSFIIDKEKAA